MACILLSACASQSTSTLPPPQRDYRTGGQVRITPQSVCYLGTPCTDFIPCDISSQTVATMPPNSDRTALGVGEQVTLTTTTGSIWTKTGNGSLSGSTGTSVTYTAGPTAGSATVVVVGRLRSCTAASTIFTIITPTVSHYNILQTYHSLGYADVGFETNIYEGPNNVSFYNTYTQEAPATYSASGVYGCWNGTAHQAGRPVPATPTVGAYGTETLGTDTSISAYCTGPNYVNQYQDGSMTINIPNQYSVGGPGPWYVINTIAAVTNATAAGVLSRTKDHASWNTTVGSPTVGF
jgi:hypothetical protein